MAQKVIVPRLGQTMKEGIVAKWLKRDGDAVQAGEDIYELEYDKAVATIQAKKSGIIRLLCEEGAAIPVSGVVGIILEENEKLEDIDLKGAYSASNLTTKGVSMSEEGTASGEPVASMPTDNSKIVKATPMIKRLAKEMVSISPRWFHLTRQKVSGKKTWKHMRAKESRLCSLMK